MGEMQKLIDQASQAGLLFVFPRTGTIALLGGTESILIIPDSGYKFDLWLEMSCGANSITVEVINQPTATPGVENEEWFLTNRQAETEDTDPRAAFYINPGGVAGGDVLATHLLGSGQNKFSAVKNVFGLNTLTPPENTALVRITAGANVSPYAVNLYIRPTLIDG